MSEIVRPTRDGIHGREYISTSVDIGKKPSFLNFDQTEKSIALTNVIDIPMPLIADMNPPEFSLPRLEPVIIEAIRQTGLIAVIDSGRWPVTANHLLTQEMGAYLPHIAFHLNPDASPIPKDVLRQTRLVEITDDKNVFRRIKEIRDDCPDIVISVRVKMDSSGVGRAIDLATSRVEVIHAVADTNGNEIGSKHPRFIKDMIRDIHNALIREGRRDEVTLIAGSGIALPEHMAKALICGADLTSTYLPLLIALECRLCGTCNPHNECPVSIDAVDFDYGVGRMKNLIAAWHLQLIELMGAMGMREARRLRGDVGRAMFFEELEEEIFGKLFGSRK